MTDSTNMVDRAIEPEERSYSRIERADLERLAAIAEGDRNDLFARRPHLAALSDLVLCMALCQGAALHFVDGRNGVKDFDVWTFYRAHTEHIFPPVVSLIAILGMKNSATHPIGPNTSGGLSISSDALFHVFPKILRSRLSAVG